MKQTLKLVTFVVFVGMYSLIVFYFGLRVGQNRLPESPIEVIGSAQVVERPTPSENVQVANVLSGNVKLCANTALSFEVAYPNDWFTTYGKKEEECFFFAPYTFVVPTSPEEYFTPITIKKIPKDEWEATVKSFENPSDLFGVARFKNIETNGRPTKYIEMVSTGNAQPKGYYKITYLLYDANLPLEITYMQGAQNEDTQNYKKILEAIVNSLRYF